MRPAKPAPRAIALAAAPAVDPLTWAALVAFAVAAMALLAR